MVWRFAVVPVWLGGIFARVHDNLDSGLVYHVLGARFWAGGMDHSVLDLHLNGVLDWTHFASLTWPLQLVYSLLAPAHAYYVTELAIVGLGYLSMYLLLRDIGARTRAADAGNVAALMACLFAMTLSFSTLGLGVAAAPMVVLLSWRRLSVAGAAALILIGWNSGLIAHAMFLPVLVVVLSLGFGRNLRGTVVPLGLYLTGSVLGAIPMFAHVLGGHVNHRSLWAAETPHLDPADAAATFAAALFGQIPYYHATITPALHTVVFLGAAVFVQRRLAVLVAGVLLAAVAIDLASPWQARFLPGVIGSLQFDRIGQFVAFLVIVLGATVLMNAPGGRGARWVRVATLLTLVQAMGVWSGVNLATLREVFPKETRTALRAEARENGLAAAWTMANLSPARLAQAVPTVQRHIRTDDYACIAGVVGPLAVASAGPDPMLAPLHGIRAVDGYHYLYPAEYHAAFRHVIADKLAASEDLRAYYDNWGSRVSLFIDRVPEVLPDFDALERLGAAFVIADRPLPLTPADTPCPLSGNLRLYRLGG